MVVLRIRMDLRTGREPAVAHRSVAYAARDTFAGKSPKRFLAPIYRHFGANVGHDRSEEPAVLPTSARRTGAQHGKYRAGMNIRR
jgi:hypothetical protein